MPMFRPKIKNKIVAILFAILPAFVVGSLVLGASMYYDLDSGKIIVNEVQRVVKSGETALEILGISKFGDGGTTNYAQFSETGDLSFVGTADTITGPGAGGMTMTNASGPLTVSTTASGTLALTSAGALNLTGAAASVWSVTSGGLTINSTSANLGLQTTTSGNITLAPASTGSVQIASGVTTGTATSSGLSLAANSLTSGYGLSLSSTSAGLTTGRLLSLDWSPASAITATGDLVNINIGANGTAGNLLNITDNGSSLFSVSETAIISNLPHSFTAAGDVSMAYDLIFTNQTASYIKSNAPLYLEAGESFESNDLTLKTYNQGTVVIDSAATTGNMFDVLGSTLTTGTGIRFTGSTSTGITGSAMSLASDIGSAGKLVSLAPDFSGSAVIGYGIYQAATDATATANTDYGYYSSLTLTGDAAKTGTGIYSTVSSASTTADTLASLDLATSATGAISADTRNVYGLRSQPASIAPSSGTQALNLYGSYLAPSSTLATAGATNVYGEYITTTATHALDAGTVNQYGLYVANGTSSTFGAATKYGLYVESPTGADSNYAAVFAGGAVGIGTAAPGGTLSILSANATGLTTSSALNLSANSLTTGTGLYAASSTLTSGNLVNLQVSGTAAAASQTALNILTAGANATSAITTYGAQISNTHTGTTSTNVALYLNASGGATANYGLIVAAGNVGIGTATPTNMLDVGSSSAGGNVGINATYGAELAPALTAGNWTVGAGWENPIVGPGLIKNADGTGTQTPSAATSIVAGKTYKVVFTVSAWSASYFNYSIGGVSASVSPGAAGTFTDYVTATNTSKLIIYPTNTSRFTISAISIKELTDSTGDLTIEGNLFAKSPSYFYGTSHMYEGLNMHNTNITAINTMISDPGASEGYGFTGTAGNWYMDVSPLNRSNADGNLNFYNSSSNNIALWRPQLWVYNATNYTTATAQSNGGLDFTTTGTGDITFNPGGKVGIGDITPDAKLDIDSTSTTGADFLITNTGIGTTGTIAGITANSVTTGDLLTVNGNALTTGSAIKVVSTSAGLTSGSLLNISSATTGAVATNGIVSLVASGAYTSTSNIGLLTVQANATLTGTIQRIEGNALTSGTALSIASSSTAFTGNLADLTLSGSNAANTGSVLSLTNSGTLNTGTTFYIKHYATGTNNLAFRVDDVSGDTSPFVIDGDGKVGIGTSAPTAKLTVRSDSTGASVVLLRMENLDTAAIGTGGSVDFYAMRTTSGTTQFASLESVVTSIDNLYYSSKLNLKVAANGALTTIMELGNPNVVINSPLQVNVAGDTGISYDLAFLSTGNSSITSFGPLTIAAGDSNHAKNLTLTTQSNQAAGESGVVASSTSQVTTVDKTLTDSAWIGGTISIVSGTGNGQVRTILANNTTTITVDDATTATDWSPTPDATSVYHLAYSRGGDVLVGIQNSDIVYGGFKVLGMGDGGYVFRISPNGNVEIGGNGSDTGNLTVKGSLTLTGGDITASQLSLSATAGFTSSTSNSGGSLSGASISTYYYKLTAINAKGETIPQATTKTQALTAITAPSTAPTATDSGTAGNVDIGDHSWKVTFTTANGETTPSAKSNVVTIATSAKQVNLTAIPTGQATVTTSRKIYRTVAGDTGDWKLVGAIADNTTTTFTDNVADVSLGAIAPVANTAYTSANTITLSWDQVVGATGYKLYRGTNDTWTDTDDRWVDNKVFTSVTTSVIDDGSGDSAGQVNPPTSNTTGGAGSLAGNLAISGAITAGVTTSTHTLTGMLCIKNSTACPAQAAGRLYVDTAGTVADDPGDVFDIAEYYPTIEPVEPGDVVSVTAPEGEDAPKFAVKKANQPYEKSLIGVVSARPAIAIEESFATIGSPATADPLKPLIALVGRVRVKVSTENGPISLGDPLTASSQSGIAMRADKAGRVIGVALESFDSAENGIIRVFVNPHWYGGQLDSTGSLQVSGDGSLPETSSGILDNFTLAIKNSLKKLGLLMENGIAKVKEIIAEKITTKEICLKGENGETTCIDKNQLKQLLEQNSAPAPTPAESGSPIISPALPAPSNVEGSGVEETPMPTPTPIESGSPAPSPTPEPEPSSTPLP